MQQAGVCQRRQQASLQSKFDRQGQRNRRHSDRMGQVIPVAAAQQGNQEQFLRRQRQRMKNIEHGRLVRSDG